MVVHFVYTIRYCFNDPTRLPPPFHSFSVVTCDRFIITTVSIQMTLIITPMNVLDAELVVQKIDYPAMQQGPLYRLMFPSWTHMTEAQQNEIVQWYTEGSRDALKQQKDKFLQICAVDGTPLGFCGWVMDCRRPSMTRTATAIQHGQAHRLPLPEVLDHVAWASVSRDLRRERERVLAGLDQVCRVTFMSVHPYHQRQGLGSRLLRRACEEIDSLGWPAFVMASPAGVQLYTKFGFDIVGEVETNEGVFTSMFR
ncbi:hypothetical protein J3F84DRAFT_367071 [Trichoderma pleuroticola]